MLLLITPFLISCAGFNSNELVIDSTEAWEKAAKQKDCIIIKDGFALPESEKSSFRSVVIPFDRKSRIESIVFKQSPLWQNWIPVDNLGPANLADAPVFLTMGPDDYWVFGRYRKSKTKNFKPQDTQLEGFDVPLKTTPFPNQYDAPGGLKPGLGGYHAWQSRDMVNWVHHGPVTEKFSKWVTTAEQVDGKVYIYYDYPNDQDPHLYIDEDLADGKPGKNMGIAFKDPSHGSDCLMIRDLEGKFHVIYEDWSPINARRHSWDSPLAGHAVSDDGIGDFQILSPAVDQRTEPTGEVATYNHPHWKIEHPDWDSNVAEYNVHKPEQNAFGDWCGICVGGQYYLFADYHPANDKIRVGWFTSSEINKPFKFCGELGIGHPDPDITFAEGKFYLITQMKTDYTSPGPWVEKVEARAGIDGDNDGKIDIWTDWQEVREKYDYIKGFSKQIKTIPASLDVSKLPAGYGFCFEFRTEDKTENSSKPIIDSVKITFENGE